jgi:hypothetical protein
MPNAIKYNVSAETLALKKGNFYIGTGDVGKGPTSSTGYYNGITPPSGGYTIYLNKETGGPSIYTASNDAQLISLTNSIAGQSYTSATQCLVYFATQTDKVCLNMDYENVVTDGLVVSVDAGFTPCYPKSGNTLYESGPNQKTGSLINGTIFSGNSFTFDGIDDYISIGSVDMSFTKKSNFTHEIFYKPGSLTERSFCGWGGGGCLVQTHFRQSVSGSLSRVRYGFWCSDVDTATVIPINQWNHLVLCYEWTEQSVTTNRGVPRIYLNGVAIAWNYTGQSFYSEAPNITNLLLGIKGGGGENWQGEIGVMRMYNRALSASEVVQNYNAQKGRFGL